MTHIHGERMREMAKDTKREKELKDVAEERAKWLMLLRRGPKLPRIPGR